MINPILNQVVVKSAMPDMVSAGGIFVPESFAERSSKATIISVGNGSKKKPMTLPTNVICWYIKGAGTEIVENGETFYLMDDSSILAYLEN